MSSTRRRVPTEPPVLDTRVSVRANRGLMERIARIAYGHDRTPAQEVRVALREYADRHDRQGNGAK
jgi:predicted transcriptional regulator